MARIIATTTPGKERDYYSKAIVVTIRDFLRQPKISGDSRDMLAFIILSLEEIAEGIEKSVAAWEKRDYWVKADKYRMEWQWTGETSKVLRAEFDTENWSSVTELLIQIMQKFDKVKISDRHRMGQPWKNASKRYQAIP